MNCINIEFNKETHTYKIGENILISTTQLLTKHKLSPDYSGVDKEILQAKANRGSLIHKEIEDYIKENKVGFTTELDQFIEYNKVVDMKHIDSELIVCNDLVAGTIDLLYKSGSQQFIADIKTTSILHRDSVSWQLSVYAYLYDKENYNKIKGQAFHFNKNGELAVVDIPLKPIDEVEKLLDCERKGQLYKQELVIANDSLVELYNIESAIIELENKVKEYKELQKNVYAQMISAMEERALKSFENDNLKITYVAPSTRKTLDTARLKEEHPELVKEYQKETTASASLRIKVKEVQ